MNGHHCAIKYGRKRAKVLAPMPGTSRIWSTEVYRPPMARRCSNIFAALTGPIPLTFSRSCWLALLRFTRPAWSADSEEELGAGTAGALSAFSVCWAESEAGSAFSLTTALEVSRLRSLPEACLPRCAALFTLPFAGADELVPDPSTAAPAASARPCWASRVRLRARADTRIRMAVKAWRGVNDQTGRSRRTWDLALPSADPSERTD